MSDVKKGLRNPLEEAQVRKAVLALQTFLEKQRASKSNKKELLSDTEFISCIITRKTIPGKASLKPIQIDLPHSLFGGENDGEMCLFVKDSDKDRIKKALADEPVPGLTKVMAVKKLRKNYKQYEDRRTLADAYDMFLADDRILPYLKTPLGSKFFDKKKQPIAVRVSRANVAASIRAVFTRTVMHTSAGACTNVKIAHFGLSVDEIVTNIIVGMNNCASHIAKGWGGIQSINVKTNESIALPIYNALSELAKLPPVASKKAQLKRKLEEVEATSKSAEHETPAPAAKKQKGKDTTPVAAKKTEEKKVKTAPVKKEKKSPVKEEVEEVKPAKKARKAETPVVEKEAKKAKKKAPVVEEKKEAKKAKKEKAPVVEEKKEEKKPKKEKKDKAKSKK